MAEVDYYFHCSTLIICYRVTICLMVNMLVHQEISMVLHEFYLSWTSRLMLILETLLLVQLD